MVDDGQQPSKRTGHIAVSYKKCMLVWGGYTEVTDNRTARYLPGTELWVFDSLTEKWSLKECHGKSPPGASGSIAVVVHDKMYIFGGYREDGNTNDLYKLDLETMEWSYIECGGPLPTPSDKMVAWQYKEKLYFFGGFGIIPDFGIQRQSDFNFILDPTTLWTYQRGWTNQFASFDPETGDWGFPNYKGPAPVPRAAHAATQVDNKIYIFGGRHQQIRMNDIHCLDMDSLTWSGSLETQGKAPQGRSWHSLTSVSKDYLALYGGFNQLNEALGDCWCLYIPTLHWFEIELSFNKPRLWHTACLSQYNEVLIYGGCTENILDHNRVPEHAGDIIVLRFSPMSLFRLSLNAVSQASFKHQWNALPASIQKILNLKLSNNKAMPVEGS